MNTDTISWFTPLPNLWGAKYVLLLGAVQVLEKSQNEVKDGYVQHGTDSFTEGRVR